MGFQRAFSNRAANAFSIWVCNDSNHITAIDAKAPVRRISIRTTCEIVLMSLTILIAGVQTTRAQESSNEAKQAQNPIARVISVPLENDFNPHTGISKNNEYILQVKPVVPLKLSNDWNLITRTVIPVIQVPDLTHTIKGTSGIGDVNLSLFLSPSRAFHQVIWGAGPIVSFPTASEDILGTKKVSVGPTAVALKIEGHWLYGALINNVFSVAGPSARADVNQMFMQPFVNYNFRHGWYLTSSPEVTADWEKQRSQRWVVPVGGGVGKIVHIEKMPVNIYTQLFRNAEYPDGTTPWSARFQMQFLFPKKG